MIAAVTWSTHSVFWLNTRHHLIDNHSAQGVGHWPSHFVIASLSFCLRCSSQNRLNSLCLFVYPCLVSWHPLSSALELWLSRCVSTLPSHIESAVWPLVPVWNDANLLAGFDRADFDGYSPRFRCHMFSQSSRALIDGTLIALRAHLSELELGLENMSTANRCQNFTFSSFTASIILFAVYLPSMNDFDDDEILSSFRWLVTLL